MAKRKIIWTHKARISRYEILKYYLNKNKSQDYSIKLNTLINKNLILLSKFPNLGIKTNLEGVRGLVIDHCILYYENKENTIIVHLLWDSRQNPDDLKIK